MAPVPVGRGLFGLRYENRLVRIDEPLLSDIAKTDPIPAVSKFCDNAKTSMIIAPEQGRIPTESVVAHARGTLNGFLRVRGSGTCEWPQ